MIDVNTNITIHGFRGNLMFNNSVTMNSYGTFSSIDGTEFSIKGKKIKGIYNLSFDRILVDGLNNNLIFNNTRGILNMQDSSFDMLDKYVLLKNFYGTLEITNVTDIQGVCNSAEIIGKNKIIIKS